MEAPDQQYLFIEVVAAIDLAGCFRIDELHKMKVDPIGDRGSILLVTVADTKTKRSRSFTVISKGSGINPLEVPLASLCEKTFFVAEGCIDESFANKTAASKRIFIGAESNEVLSGSSGLMTLALEKAVAESSKLMTSLFVNKNI
ncbi:hypothetical protein ILUMI_22205 [Ignelater luminosus]|uniref:Uncharacterized protein n=1 Tax=Ignelater luminosus TaxID=2038154 RepID=A0A8K0G0R5_IGNLU|nr:hypothetical protein ILUMI_22205 [Ignelater luminosus]